MPAKVSVSVSLSLRSILSISSITVLFQGSGNEGRLTVAGNVVVDDMYITEGICPRKLT
jgi:hypothetical protein